MDQTPPSAYVTLLTKPSYLPGVLVLDHSLRSVGSRYPLVVMITPSLSEEAKNILRRRGIDMRDIQSLHPTSASGEPLFEDRFADTWTKLRYYSCVCTLAMIWWYQQGFRAIRVPCRNLVFDNIGIFCWPVISAHCIIRLRHVDQTEHGRSLRSWTCRRPDSRHVRLRL